MSGTTVELGLGTAVDADDTADYLTLTLADSLRTVDALFNNVTGHNHSGSHQGGPIAGVPPAAIPDGSITSAKIVDGTIQAIDLADGAVTTPKLANGAVTSAKIGGDITLPGALTTTGNISVFGGTYAILFGDATHYLQARPAGQTNTLAWSHDFLVNGNSTTIGRGTFADLLMQGSLPATYFGSDGVVNIARQSISSATHALVVHNSDGFWVQDSNITLYNVSDPQGGGQSFRTIAASTRPAATYGAGEVHIGLRLFCDGDIEAGTYVHGIAFVQTSDPNLKANMTAFSDDTCMQRVRDPRMPVYTYQITPPVTGGVTPTIQDIGFSAADVYAASPEFAALDQTSTPVGVTYTNMAALLWGALRQLDARVQALEAA